MTYSANAKITRVFDSRGSAFLEGTRLIPRSNLHWFIGKLNTQVQALGLHVNLDIKSIATVHLLTVTDSTNNYDLWHARLGHPSSQVLQHVSRAANSASDISVPSQAPLCSDCQKGKMPSRTFSPSAKRATKPLQLVHCDLLEFPTLSYHRDKWCLLIIDDYSGFGNACLLHSKADTAGTFRNWVLWAEKQTSHSLLQVRSDRGGEFMAREFRGLLTSKGVEHQLSVADHPQQNGRAERFNRTLLEKEETMRHAACLSENLWNFAFQTAAHVYNRTPMRRTDWKTPVELFLGKKPDISYL